MNRMTRILANLANSAADDGSQCTRPNHLLPYTHFPDGPEVLIMACLIDQFDFINLWPEFPSNCTQSHPNSSHELHSKLHKWLMMRVLKHPWLKESMNKIINAAFLLTSETQESRVLTKEPVSLAIPSNSIQHIHSLVTKWTTCKEITVSFDKRMQKVRKLRSEQL